MASASTAGDPKPDVIARVVGVTLASASVLTDPSPDVMARPD